MSQRYRIIEERRQRTHRMLIFIILATLPCWFCGIVLLFVLSSERPVTSPTPTMAITETETPTDFPTIMPSRTPGGPTLTALPNTPTQSNPPTRTPVPADTLTPTETLTPTQTTTPDLNATGTIDALLTQAARDLTATAVTYTPTPTKTLTPTLTATALPPVANADTATTPKNTSKTIDVLANDTGTDKTINSWDTESGEGGSVDCTGGMCTYNPPPGFVGADSFFYDIIDSVGRVSEKALVTITVTGP